MYDSSLVEVVFLCLFPMLNEALQQFLGQKSVCVRELKKAHLGE